MTPAKRKTATGKIADLVGDFNGKIVQTLEWGQKALSYPIGNAESGFYYTLCLETAGEDIKKLNDKLRVDEGILRYLIIKTNAHRAQLKK